MANVLLSDLETVKATVDAEGNKQDGWLRTQLRLVSVQIARHLRRAGAIDQISRTEILDVRAGALTFRLRASPLVSVTTVRFDRQQDFTNGTVVEAADRVNHLRKGLVEIFYDLVGTWGQYAPQALEIVYVGGIVSGADDAARITSLRASEFADLEQACILQVQAVVKRQQNSPQEIRVSGQGGSVSLPELNLTAEVRRILKPYKRVNV